MTHLIAQSEDDDGGVGGGVLNACVGDGVCFLCFLHENGGPKRLHFEKSLILPIFFSCFGLFSSALPFWKPLACVIQMTAMAD